MIVIMSVLHETCDDWKGIGWVESAQWELNFQSAQLYACIEGYP